MFGYIKPYTSELRVRENEYYRAVYCGLCRSLGKCTGCGSRLTLNYDFVFAALLRLAATGEAPEIEPHRCAVHPVRRRPMASPCDGLDFCARAGVILSYLKTEDDIADERGGKRFRARTAHAFMRGMNRRAKVQLEEAYRAVSDGLAGLGSIEREHRATVDIPADCFGELMGGLLSAGLSGDAKRILTSAGFHLGRWLYIIDAADDMEEDRKHGRFNPFLLLYGGEALDAGKKSDIFNALTAELIELSAVCDLLTPGDGQNEIFSLINNILQLGMPHTAQRVLFGEQGKESKHERSL